MFSQIYGQEHIADYVVKAHAKDRLAHTLLLSGRAGYGLFALGKAIAAFILCQNKIGEACGECTDCRKSFHLQHPDLHLFFPTHKAGATTTDFIAQFRACSEEHRDVFDSSDWLTYLGESNKTLNINKDIIAEMNHAFSFKSFGGGKRVFLVWGSEYLGKEGNKLLKVIEEPPEDAYIILLTENRKRILSTIISRCQSLRLKPLGPHDLLKNLELESNEDNIKLVQWAHGDLKAARSVAATSKNMLRDSWMNYLRTAFKGSPVELIETSTTLANDGKEHSRQFLLHGLGLTSQLLNSAMGIPIENSDSVEKLARLMTLDDLEALQKRLQKDYNHVNRNANLKLLFASQSIWLAQLFRKQKKSKIRT